MPQYGPMLNNCSLKIDSMDLRRGEAVTGVIEFECPGRLRMLSDFAVSLTLRADLHTAIPTSAGLQKHSNQVVYNSTVLVHGSSMSIPGNKFRVPFTHRVLEKCPISVEHKSIAKLQHRLIANVSDLSAAFSQPWSASEYLEILPSVKRSESIPSMKRHKKINYTANPVMVPGAPYFIQFQYPAYMNIAGYKMSLTSELNVLGASTFVRNNERSFDDINVIARKSPDGSNISVLKVKAPAELACTVDGPGFSRKYKIFVHISIEKNTPVVLSFDVEVLNATAPIPSTPIQSPSRPIPVSNKSINSTAPLRPIRASPVPFSAPLLIPNKSPLRNLSMQQLSTRALSSPSRVTSAVPSPVVSSPASISGSIRSARSNSDQESMSPGSPKSSGSSASSFSELSSSPTLDLQKPYFGLRSCGSKEKNHGKSASTSTILLTKDKKHHTKSSSVSSITSISAKRLSLSLTRLSSKLGHSKPMEFSCCGPPAGSPVLTENFEFANSPSATTSSKSTKKLPSRRLSFRRPSLHSAGSSTKSERPGSCRSSISDDYLSSSGFQFDGIKSLDDGLAGQGSMYEYRYEDDDVEVKDILGVAM